jgi:cytochrome c biogenesis protein CcdA
MDEETLLDPLELIYADITFNDLMILSGSTLLLGLLDAFNPCALAMLLMFLSFLTDKKRSKTILYICFSYILAVFVTYFILGRFLATALSALLPYMKVFYSIIILLALFISILNFLDFMSARKQKYGEIKNQLPNKFFVLTRKIMSNFSEKIESGNKMIYVTAFLIGAFVAIVEFPCSGQAFVAWTAIVVDRTTHFLLFNILLFIYVLFFVAPLIIITFIGLRAKSINTVSNFIRTRLDIIKLMNSIIFLGVAIYYIYKVFIGGI